MRGQLRVRIIMTTTVYDVDASLVASDSRWSAYVNLYDGQYLFFVDNTGFNKLVDRLGAVLVLAGDGELIAEWKKWWACDELNIDNMPSVALNEIRKISVMIVSKEDREILFDAGPKLAIADEFEDDNARRYLAVFSGSGQQFASQCWFNNRCYNQSILTASANDPCTGGDVKYINFATNAHNTNDENFDYTSIQKSLMERGMLMKLADKNVIPLDQHLQSEEIKDKIANGAIRASAPSGKESTFVWNEARLAKLSKAINKVTEIEHRMNAQ